MVDAIPLFEIAWGREEVRNVVDSVGRGMYWAKGPYVDEFEERLEDYLGVNHALVVNSGTTALVSALEALEVGQGDEVIVPPFTFIATANAVKLVGADPVFADIERTTYGLDPHAVESKITEDTAAIMPVYVYGSVPRIERLQELAEEYDVALIEDAAAALGAEVGARRAGTFGDVAAFSFAQNKIVATGEGGAVVTDDEDIAKRVKLYRSHGRATSNYFESSGTGQYVSLGSNYRMPDVVAGIGCAQMSRVEDLIDGRRDVARTMSTKLGRIDGIEPFEGRTDGRHVYQLFTITLTSDLDRERYIQELKEQDIASKVYWDPVHLTDFYREEHGYTVGDFPVTEEIASRVLSLPIHPELSPTEIDRIVTAISDL